MNVIVEQSDHERRQVIDQVLTVKSPANHNDPITSAREKVTYSNCSLSLLSTNPLWEPNNTAGPSKFGMNLKWIK